jgi:hypothetical protein
MGLSALLHYGCFVPVWVYCGAFRRDIYPIRTGEVASSYTAKHIPDQTDAGGSLIKSAVARFAAKLCDERLISPEKTMRKFVGSY